MWQWFTRKSKKKSNNRQPRNISPKPPTHQVLEETNDVNITTRIDETIAFFQKHLGENDDIVMRQFRVFDQHPAVIIYFSVLVEKIYLNNQILKPLMLVPPDHEKQGAANRTLKDVLLNDVLYAAEGKTEYQLNQLLQHVLEGQTILVIEGMHEAIYFDTRYVDKRAITQPETEQVIRGAREGFIELMDTNISLLRYRLPTPDFRVKTIRLGRITKSKVAVCYLEGVVNPQLVEEVFSRLSLVDIDGILDAGYLEQFIEDNHFSPFPQIQYTERPDKAVANMLEGRVIIMVDGSPFALILPIVFSQLYQTIEDYSERFVLSSFVRLARLVALVFSLIFPSLYVALISFNPELIPTAFAAAVSGARAGVPFPAVIEVLVMEVSMEVLREATLRLPQQVGGALSIVGVLVIGQAAVAAGFVSPITVVIIAITTIGSFATPAFNVALALRMLRFPLIVLSGIFGLYGVMVGLIVIVNHMLSLKSFGVPYMTPLVPGNFQGMKDTVARLPLWFMPKRPSFLHTPNDNRIGKKPQGMNQKPNNTLDPLKAGNERKDETDGLSSSDNDDSSGDHNI
jgi:spore germination protein KA